MRNEVTTPKLLPPPLRARKRSGWEAAEAVTAVPLGRTRSYSRIELAAQPCWAERKLRPSGGG